MKYNNWNICKEEKENANVYVQFLNTLSVIIIFFTVIDIILRIQADCVCLALHGRHLLTLS